MPYIENRINLLTRFIVCLREKKPSEAICDINLYNEYN